MLSDAKIRALKPKAKSYRVTDANRLYLQVEPGGGRHWRFGYTFGGKQKTLALGSYPAVTLLAARMARDTAKLLLTEGIDPSAARKAERDPATPAPTGETFKQVADRWFRLNEKKWVSAYAVRLRNRMSQDVLPHLGDKPIAGIVAKDVLDMLRLIEGRGAVEMGRRVHQMVSQVFRFAVAEGLVQFDPSRDIGGALAPKPPVKRRSALPADEIPDFLAALRTYQGEPATVRGLQLIIHTAVRTSELRFAEWHEFENLDGDEPLWRIPAAKMKIRRDHIVPLTLQAVAAIKAMKPLNGHLQWVFATADGKPMSQNTLIFALYRLGHHSKATVHGFRSSFSTWANERQLNRDWIELQLAHVDGSIRGVYNAALYLPQRREMMRTWSDYIEPIQVSEGDAIFGDLL